MQAISDRSERDPDFGRCENNLGPAVAWLCHARSQQNTLDADLDWLLGIGL
jgi:hypothetical protein